MMERAFQWADANQVRTDVPERQKSFRNRTRGAFPFSTAEQAWPVTDCTAEGIKVALLSKTAGIGALSGERLRDAVDVLLEEQNDDGGWSEYERARTGPWIEHLNAAEVFGDIMIGYSHPECTAACITGIAALQRDDGAYRATDIDRALTRGARYLERVQRDDGSFYGCWGICFTYATWFGIEGLIAAARSSDLALRVTRACAFLVEKQNPDGGWGESYLSSVEKRWVSHERSQPVQTAWSLLGLLAAIEHLGDRFAPHDRERFEASAARAAKNLVATQTDDGWPYDMVYGVFNRNCMINYDNYRYYFPLWGLARFDRVVGSSDTRRTKTR